LAAIGSYVASMAKVKDLIAVHVSDDDVGDYNVTEAGWYAVDDGEKVVLGPFTSLPECERAIRDRLRSVG
jgi:putative methionine-R-sulfoxide reductase with GAF domain